MTLGSLAFCAGILKMASTAAVQMVLTISQRRTYTVLKSLKPRYVTQVSIKKVYIWFKAQESSLRISKLACQILGRGHCYLT